MNKHLENRINLKLLYNELCIVLERRNAKQRMLFSLLINTQCSGCGKKNKVCLNGYVNKYCNRGCWRVTETDSGYESNNDFYPQYEVHMKYYYLKCYDKIDLSSKAYSTYHRSREYYGLSWPMIKTKKCFNWCIINKKPLSYWKDECYLAYS